MQLVENCRLDETALAQCPGPPPVPRAAARQLSRLAGALVVEAGGRGLNGQSAHPSHRLVEIPKWGAILCTARGSHATSRYVNILESCPPKPLPTGQEVLSRVLRGLRPSHKGPPRA
eukprot:5651372-Pyramimonas_sp.AAC.1